MRTNESVSALASAADDLERVTKWWDGDPRPPLSVAQERVWFYDIIAPEAPFHGVPRLISLEGRLDSALLTRALNEVVKRHALLRCVYRIESGVPQQIVRDRVTLEIPLVDLRAIPEASRDLELDRLTREAIQLQFDLQRGPLIRGHLFRTADEHHVFLLNFHHIVCDGWSERVALNEITRLYEAYACGESSPLADLPLQYFDYAVWQRRRLASPLVEGDHEYWRGQLGEALPMLDLPTDRPHPPVPTYSGSSLGYEVSPELGERMREFARSHNATVYMTMLAAFYALLYRYTEQTDIVIGSPINNRERAEIHDLIGYFVTRLPLRLQLDGKLPFVDLLARVRRVALDAFRHKETTAERWPYPRSDGDVPEASNYRVMFFFQENPVGVERRFGDLRMTNANVKSAARIAMMGLRSPTLSVQLDIGFFLEPVGDRIFGWIEFNTDVFDEQTVARMRDHYLRLLASAVSDPSQEISHLELIGEEERRELLPRLSQAALEMSQSGATLTQLWQQRLDASANAIAIVAGDKSLTFSEVDRSANAVAHKLLDAGLRHEDVVGVHSYRSPEFIIAVLGVLKAGAACLPLDAQLPDRRLQQMARAARCRMTISQDAGVVMPAGMSLQDLIQDERDTPPAVTIASTALAFVFFSSGSTGTPKLVEIHHAAAACGQAPNIVDYPLQEQDVFLMTTPVASARVVGEIFWPLLNGARLAIASDDDVLSPTSFAEVVEEQQVTAFNTVPSLLEVLVSEPALGRCGTLRLVQAVGEPVTRALVRAFAQLLPHAVLVNGYAQTEAAPVLFWECAAEDERLFAPVGRPATVATAYVLDERLQPVPAGVVGDLYVGGLCVSRGYRDDPATTAAEFGPDPYAGTPGARMYHTGDRARLRNDGALEFLGRRDMRVKVSGYSVDVLEIEATLLEDPRLDSVLVAAEHVGQVGNRLVAYFVPKQGAKVSEDELRAEISQRLPRHMVPAQFVPVRALSTTATGKIDRSVRPEPIPSADGSGDDPEPLDGVEARVAAVWAEVLQREQVGLSDDFFSLGGTSLLGIRVVWQVGREFGVRLPIRSLFDGRTVEAMCRYIRGR